MFRLHFSFTFLWSKWFAYALVRFLHKNRLSRVRRNIMVDIISAGDGPTFNEVYSVLVSTIQVDISWDVPRVSLKISRGALPLLMTKSCYNCECNTTHFVQMSVWFLCLWFNATYLWLAESWPLTLHPGNWAVSFCFFFLFLFFFFLSPWTFSFGGGLYSWMVFLFRCWSTVLLDYYFWC